MKVVGYARQSVDNDGDSLLAQAEAIEAFCKREGHYLVGMESETVSGALDADVRDGLARAITMIQSGEAEGLVVLRLDRLSRKLTVSEAVLSVIWRSSGSVWEVIGGLVPKDDPSDPYKTFVRQVMSAAAELERGLVISRMQGGRRRAAAQGRHLGGSRPFGYSVGDDGTLMPRDDELAVIRRVQTLRSQGHSLRRIGKACGIPSPETVRRLATKRI